MITINTLGDLRKCFTGYPECIQYLIEGETGASFIFGTDEIKRFFAEYVDYEVVDFSYSSHSIALFLTLKKGEPDDDND